jgi:GAF domain-containing protein
MELDPKVLDVVRRPSRLQALAALEANAESSAEALDRITRIACRALDVPVALINLISDERQRFMGCGSLPEPWASMGEMPLDAGWCPFALDADQAYAFADARADATVAENPAAQQLGVVAYAGVPLRTAGGEAVGTLCAVDYEPHDWTEDELALMADLAESALAELQLLSASRFAARTHERLHALESVSCALATAATPEDVLGTVIGAVERTDAGALWTVAEDESALDAAAAAGDGEAVAERVPLDAPLAPARVARGGEAEFLTSRSDVKAAFGLREAPVGAVALLPVMAGDRRIGVLGACYADERLFSDEDREYLAALAGISGLALAHG